MNNDWLDPQEDRLDDLLRDAVSPLPSDVKMRRMAQAAAVGVARQRARRQRQWLVAGLSGVAAAAVILTCGGLFMPHRVPPDVPTVVTDGEPRVARR